MYARLIAVCLVAALLQTIMAIIVSSNIALPVDSSPDINRSPIPADFIAYSIEFGDWVDYAGNLSSSPNSQSYNLVQHLINITGAGLKIGVGGGPQEKVTYVANQTDRALAHRCHGYRRRCDFHHYWTHLWRIFRDDALGRVIPL